MPRAAAVANPNIAHAPAVNAPPQAAWRQCGMSETSIIAAPTMTPAPVMITTSACVAKPSAGASAAKANVKLRKADADTGNAANARVNSSGTRHP